MGKNTHSAGRALERSATRRATTLRLDPPLQAGLALLQSILKRPLNRLVNEAVRGFLEVRMAQAESELENVLSRIKAYRRSDPDFHKAIARFVDAEARLGPRDPAEGRSQAGKGPAQSMIRSVLQG